MKSDSGKKGVFWSALDSLLVFAIFLLIGYALLKGNAYSSKGSGKEEAAEKGGVVENGKIEEEEARPKRRVRVVNGIRVSNGFAGGRKVESMAEGDWSGARTSPAMDMRENGKSFEVVFALSGEIDQQSVSTATDGNVLKLSMKKKSGKEISKKVFIPWHETLEGANLQHQITNGLLRVKITP